MDNREQAFDDLIGSLYDAVMAPDGFQSFIEQLARTFDFKGVALVVRHLESRDPMGLWLHGIAPCWMESYALDYGREDVLARHLETMPIGQFYASNLDLEPEGFTQTRFFNEWVRPQGVAYAAACIVMREGLWLTQVFLQRSPQHPPFARDEMDWLDRLVPHWQRATQMRQRLANLRTGQDFLAASLDTIAMPTLLFDEYACIVHQNRNATTLLADSGNLWLDEGRLMTSSPAVTRNLHLHLTKAVLAGRDGVRSSTGVVLHDRAGRMSLTLMVIPLRTSGTGAQPRSGALLFVFDPETVPVVTAELVRRLFGLTPAEADLAVALCGGQSPDEIACGRGRSVATVRTQIRSLFAKTGTNRQADLIGLMLASPAYFVAQEHRDALN